MSSRMDVSGGLAAPTAVLGALGGEVCQPKAGVQIYDEVTDSVIEAFIMMLMVGARRSSPSRRGWSVERLAGESQRVMVR